MFVRLEREKVHPKERLLIRLSFQRASLMYRLTDTKVAGKKAIVTTAIAFMADASRFASSAIRT